MTQTGLRRDPFSFAIGLWLVLGAVIGVRTLVSPVRHSVFPIFAGSAAHWWADQPLYDWRPPLDRFRYPPPFAVAIAPFAILGLRFGGLLWSWGSMAVYVVGLRLFARDVLPERWSRERSAAFLALGAIVALPGLWNAQSNTLVVGLLLLAASGVVRQRWWTAAFLMAAATWIKLTPLAPALLLCALWPRRLAPRLMVALFLVAAVPFLTKPAVIVLEHYAEWLGALIVTGRLRWPGFRDGWTVWLVVRHLCRRTDEPLLPLKPIDSIGYPILQLATAVLTWLWCLRQQVHAIDRRRLVCATFAMATAWLMLFGPAVEHTTYTFLAPLLAWALLEGRTRARGRWLIGSAFVLIAVLGWDPLTHPWIDRVPLLLAALPVGTVLFVMWLTGWASRTRLDGQQRDRPSVRCARSLALRTPLVYHPRRSRYGACPDETT